MSGDAALRDGHARSPAGGRARRRLRRAAFALAVAVGAVILVRGIRQTEPPLRVVADSTVAALPLEAGATSGTITEDDAPAPDGRRLDAWVFSTDTDEPLTITIAAAFAPSLAVRGPDGSVHDARPDSADSHVARVVGLRGKGAYNLTVSSSTAGETGRYTLTIHQDPIPMELVPDGRPRAGELGARARALPDGRYEDPHSFDARAGQPYLVLLDADSLFAHVVVRSPEGDSLGGVVYERLRTARGGHASVARFTPRYPGRYLVDVGSNAPGGVGHYLLSLRTRSEPVPVGRDILRGVLGLVSQLRDSGYVDVFTFEGRGGRAVAFEVRPPGFTLALLDPDGETLASGPRAGVILPADGRYRVEVSSTRPRGTGSYDLVPAIPPVPPPPPDTTKPGLVGW